MARVSEFCKLKLPMQVNRNQAEKPDPEVASYSSSKVLPSF
jgi:hypothetical protein